jgi:hypothetical protein
MTNRYKPTQHVGTPPLDSSYANRASHSSQVWRLSCPSRKLKSLMNRRLEARHAFHMAECHESCGWLEAFRPAKFGALTFRREGERS